jgi:pimeloyl-ACP methyl ester carboxylesterase
MLEARHPRRIALGLCAAVLLVTGCGPPIKVERVNPQTVSRSLTSNVLSTGRLTNRSRNLLYRQDLVTRFQDDPAGALAELHAALVAGKLRPDDTVAVAEIAFYHADHGGGQPYYLASAIYAWSYLFPADPKDVPGRMSPRLRLACDLYNRGVTEGLQSGGTVQMQSGTYPLPFGALDVTLDPTGMWIGKDWLTDFVPTAELQVSGFPTYYRWPGIGAPLAAGIVEGPGSVDPSLLARRARIPVTALLRFDDLAAELHQGRVQAVLEVHQAWDEETVQIRGWEVPLETEPTAALALALHDAPVWKTEYAGFLHGAGVIDKRAQLLATRPYQPGLIPVVFVHGTASSAGRWAEMYNELDNDPRIHERYQFWFFSYSTGNPIAYSAMLLHEALERTVKQLDPDGRDPALQRMVVIGHSQGGLLTKTTVVESGDRFWQNVSHRPFDEVRMSDQSRDLLRRGLFIHPLPFVRRVIFIATPHHGSYVAGSWIAHQVARLARAPLDVTTLFGDVVTANREALTAVAMRGTPTAVDNMTPGNPFVKTLADLPIAPGVAANSIIAITDGHPSPTAGDGVVKYESAHIEGVESELIVTSPHSCQANPHTIEEVRRILLEHLTSP